MLTMCITHCMLLVLLLIQRLGAAHAVEGGNWYSASS
jgi:hypothetical protein